MPSLTVCAKKVGSALDPKDRATIINRSRELRAAGMGATEAAKKATRDLIAELRAEFPAQTTQKVASATVSRGTPQAKKHPATVMGSRLLAVVSNRLGGLDPAWIAEFSIRAETARKGKDGKPIIQWRNPMVPGVGKLFRKGGTQDLQAIAEVLESEGYLAPGSVERDGKEAGEASKTMIRRALERDEIKTLDETQAEEQAAQDAEREAYYAELDAEAAREAEAEREAIMAEHELEAIDQLADDDIPWDMPSTASLQQTADFLGITVEELQREEGLSGPVRQDEQAQAAGGQEDRLAAGQGPQPPPESGSAAAQQGSAAEGLTLESQTPADLRAKAEQEQAAQSADKAEQKRLAEKAKADAEALEFTLTGSDRPADVAAAAGQMPLLSRAGGSSAPGSFREDRNLGPRQPGEETISTRVPTSVNPAENAIAEKLSVGIGVVAADPTLMAKHAAIIKPDPITGKPAAGTEEQVIERFVESLKANLLFLYDSVPEKVRQRSRNWYVGANTIAGKLADLSGASKRAASGVLAALSPQTPWDVNVSQAGRVIFIWKNHQRTKADAVMDYWFQAQAEKIEADDKSAEAMIAIRRYLRGKALREVDDRVLQAWWVRAYDETHHDRSYWLVAPEGQPQRLMVKKNGDPSNMPWGNTGNIAKALSILSNDSIGNISEQLGVEHKVRSFYNNIVDPNSKDGHVTIDTHAVAAARLEPLSGNSAEVGQAWGGKGSSSVFGQGGLYGEYAEAYRRAAQERGVLPREMQSVTWEAVRGLFPDTFKTKDAYDEIRAIWLQHQAGAITAAAARRRIVARAGGVTGPNWSEGGDQDAGTAGSARDQGKSGGGARPGKVADTLLSRSEGAAAGIPFTDLERMVSDIARNWVVRAKPQVVATASDLPAPIVDALRSQKALGDTRGLRMPDGRVFLVADKLASMDEAQAVLFHEVYGHEGLRAFLGDAYVSSMAMLRMANPKLAAEANAWYAQYGQDQINASVEYGMSRAEAGAVVRALAVEEALADRAGANPPPSAWKSIMAKLQQALRKMGLGSIADKLEAMTEAETYAVLIGARRAIQQGTQGGALPAWLQPAASREAPTWYSALLAEVNKSPMNAGTAGAWAQYLDAMVKRGAVKADEIEWTGVRDWLQLQTGKVSKDQVGQFLASNGVQVSETVLSDARASAWAMKDALAETGYDAEIDAADEEVLFLDPEGDYVEYGDLPENVQAIVDRLTPRFGKPSKYGQYTLPGGTNYREVLLTLPGKPDTLRAVPHPDSATEFALAKSDGSYIMNPRTKRPMRWSSLQLAEGYGKRTYDEARQGQYKSSHWDQPNILAHIRVNDRTDADGKRVLFVEEIQSDWAQQGKKQGIGVTETRGRVFILTQADGSSGGSFPTREAAEAERARLNGQRVAWQREPLDTSRWTIKETETIESRKGVPVAPFIDSTDKWVALAIKRVISMAAREGYDRVAFVTGEQSAERYDLSKQINSLVYDPDREWLLALDKEDRKVIDKQVPVKELPDVIGKEAADKLLKVPLKQAGSGRLAYMAHIIEGADLKVGGEGMRAFYDKIVPSVLKDVLRKVGGGRVASIGVPNTQRDTGPVMGMMVMDWMGMPREQHSAYWAGLSQAERNQKIEEYRNRKGGAVLQQLGFDITPAMREKAAGGLPLFRRDPPTVETQTVEGRPVFRGQGLVLDFPLPTERLEVIPEPGQEVLNYPIMPETGFESLGFVELLVESGRPISLLDIEINRAGRAQGVGRRVIETLLAANPTADLNISNIVEDARGFWARMGIPEQNRAPGEAYDGTLNWQTYAHAQAENPSRTYSGGRSDGQARGRADAGAESGVQGPLGQAPVLSRAPGQQPAQAPLPAGTTTVRTASPLAGIATGWRDPTNRLQFAPGAWLYSALGRLASPLLVKFQLKAASPELRKQLRAMKLDVQKAQDVAAAVAAETQTLSEAERTMVSDIIEKELASGIVPPTHAVRLAGLMTQAMSTQSRELVRLGMLSQEAADRWDGAYLPRFYESKLRNATDAWADAVRKLLGRTSVMKGIKGKHLKGRGLYETIRESELPNWEAMGWEVRDPDYQPGLPSIDGRVQVWRDYTRQERDDMGEIRDAGFRFVMGYMQTQRDIALGRMFEKMANDPESSSRTPREGWMRVPDGTIEGTGAKRYGKLAGRYVPRETLSHLSQIEEAQSEAWQMYRKAMAVWKMGKTAMNPVSHVNNILSNLTMAHFAGVSYHRGDLYLKALKEFATGAQPVKEARDAGLFLGTLSDAELMETLPQELKDLAIKADSKAIRSAKFVFDAMTLFVRKPMGAAYQAEDTFFRYLIYSDARRRGMAADDAVDHAQRFIFAYDDLPKGARMIRDFGIPFFSYTYKAIPALLHTALTHPARFAAPAAVMWAANAMAYALANSEDGDDWWETLQRYLKDPEFRAKVKREEQLEREVLPPWMKGMTAMATPKAIRLGTDEVTKLPVFIDVARIVPGGDLFDVSPNAGGLPIPQPLTPSHPLLTIATAMIGNKDLWTGKDLVDKNDTRGEATEKRAEWMWKQISPAMAIGNYHWERGMNALAQASGGEITWMPEFVSEKYTGTGRDGLPVQPGYAAMQTFGIKARPLDLERSRDIAEGMQKKMIREIDAEVRQLGRLNKQGAISDKLYEKKVDEAKVKKERLKEGLTVDGDARD